ncbi:hypothetical protein DVA67_028635 [Solirubrobacter sp. CPCC 204708]|uniref:Uncharacterized protein n=1 Tax=Solirubrobacter deserti TaxID=2282478 RepID=A0ABT4RPE4_9ACTN|nr:hypothetical protein [Solirubrobacter deserti]MBE2319966.1 hypothetical protein [Solirubrobacter deserti]MDA0140437.1 hypothetical protein [Solirubrobacter deserti]
MTGSTMHIVGDSDAWSWPPVGEVEEPLRTPLWLIRTLADALAEEDQPSIEHRQHVARQIARTAEELERSLMN